jgi:hypothetical protein
LWLAALSTDKDLFNRAKTKAFENLINQGFLDLFGNNTLKEILTGKNAGFSD